MWGREGGSGVGGFHLHTNSGAPALFDHAGPAVRGIYFGLRVKRKRKVDQIYKHVVLENSCDLETRKASFGETKTSRLCKTLGSFCSNKEGSFILAELSFTNVPDWLRYFYFPTVGKAGSNHCKDEGEKRKQLLARLAWMLPS